MADLPNCPFCGGLAHVEFFAKGPNRGDDAICCVNPDCDASSAHINRTTWNRRTPPAGAGEAVARITVEHFRGDPNMENVTLDYFGNLSPGSHALYAAPTPLPEAARDEPMDYTDYRREHDHGAER